MRKVYIYIDDDKSYHKCEVSSIKKDLLSNEYYIYFFDSIYNSYYVSSLEFINGSFYISDIQKEMGELNFLDTLIKSTHKKQDITHLQPVINSVKHKDKILPSIKDLELHNYYENKDVSAFSIKRIDYLELISYADATKTKYLYFIIDDMNVNELGYEYSLRFVCESDTPLKKNIVAKHRTDKSLSDIYRVDGEYYMSFELKDILNINLELENKFVKALYNHFKPKYKLDTEVLTKIVRIMLSKKDYVEAARSYNYYLNTYYVPYLKNKKENIKLMDKH